MVKFRSITAATALMLAIGSPPASAQDASCAARLQHITAEWDAIGFALPTKPAQARVVARDGHVASGPDVIWLATELRYAAQDCALGRDATGLHRLSLVQDRLNRL